MNNTKTTKIPATVRERGDMTHETDLTAAAQAVEASESK